MGRWSRERDRFYKQVKQEVNRMNEDVNDELDRFRNRIAGIIEKNITTTDSRPVQNETREPAVVASVIAGSEEVKTSNTKCNPLGLTPGRAFIINHKTFDDNSLQERSGSELDVKRLQEVLANFEISSKVIDDGTTSDVTRLMEEVETYNFTSHSCLILVIMSHGHECNIISAKDGTYSLYKDVLYPILRNATLVGKTKMLFVQSCKGITNLAYELDSKLGHEQPTKKPDEILQFCSCVEGYVSYAFPTGSLFIEILCEKLADLGETEDIRVICNAVIEAVKEDIYDLQIPMLHTNLTEPFVLGHYKMREISDS